MLQGVVVSLIEMEPFKIMQLTKLIFQSVLLSSVFLGLVSCGTSQHADGINASAIEGVEQTNIVHYLCDNKPLITHFHADKATVFWQQKNYLLTEAASMSGRFYLGDNLSFWVQGDSAELVVNYVVEIPCQLSRIES